MTEKEFKFQYALGALSEDALESIAEKSTSKYILTTLSKNDIWYIRGHVAENPNTPVKVLTNLSNDKDWFIRKLIAQHPNTPVEVLTKLAEDEEWRVKFWVTKALIDKGIIV